MRHLLFLTLLLSSLTGWAKTGSQPAPSDVPGADYPRVDAEGRITFRIKAPDAQKVQLYFSENTLDMARDQDGFWSLTTSPAVPGFHYYWFLVDGVAVNDPESESYFGWGKPTSGIEVPEQGVDFYLVRNVPHGEVRARWYYSSFTGQWRRFYLYTPPGYDKDPETRFPVLYLQHGAGEDERAWSNQGRVNFILDNLIAAGKAKPMIVAMECGYAVKKGGKPVQLPWGSSPDKMEEAFRLLSGDFGELLLQDLVPFVDANYRTLPDRGHRALAGLSMGGIETLQVGLGHLDQFAYLGAFSAPSFSKFDVETSFGGVFKDAQAANQKIRLLWLGAGTKETQIHDSVLEMHQALDKAGVRNVFFESKGTAHEWQTWRRDLRDFAPRLFGD
jgi:enterochelin esterase-like enzyme